MPLHLVANRIADLGSVRTRAAMVFYYFEDAVVFFRILHELFRELL